MTSKVRFKLITAAYLLLIQNNKILLSRRKNTGYEDGKYSLPSGHLEEHETIRMAGVREVAEEIGLHVIPQELKLVHVMHRKHLDERIDFFFTIKKWKGSIMNNEPEKCDDLCFFPLDNLPSNTIPFIKSAIENFQSRILYSEFGWV